MVASGTKFAEVGWAWLNFVPEAVENGGERYEVRGGGRGGSLVRRWRTG
jgi:hypothetical protein